jgi:imidazolonepropionase
VAGTINAAHAIGVGDRVGSLEPGKQADLLMLDAPDFRHLACHFGGNLVAKVVKKGTIAI